MLGLYNPFVRLDWDAKDGRSASTSINLNRQPKSPQSIVSHSHITIHGFRNFRQFRDDFECFAGLAHPHTRNLGEPREIGVGGFF